MYRIQFFISDRNRIWPDS